MDSENLSSLIRLSVSDGQKTDSSKVVSVKVYNKILYQCTFSAAKHNIVSTLKQQNNFIDLPKVIGFKAHKQREYQRNQVATE